MTNHPNRSRIWQTAYGSVCLRTTDKLGDKSIREFWVPPGGGYVREINDTHPAPLGQQVCGALSRVGYTLRCDPDGLLDVIRREYRRAVRMQRA